MSSAFRGERLHIAVLGRCNTGKSTVLNCLTGQDAAIVSPEPGTTGDPVPLAYELPPLGPVTFYDTAGLDEESALGALRREAGRKILARSDIALIVTDENGIGFQEKECLDALAELKTPCLVLFNKKDRHGNAVEQGMAWCDARSIPHVSLSADRTADPAGLREALIRLAPDKGRKPPLVMDILAPESLVVCVTPIDDSAPAGRLIAPQVQVLRELVEEGHNAVLARPNDLSRTLGRLREEPALVITDSQAVKEVAATLPAHVPLTTFSVVFARHKGDFSLLLQGAKHIDALKPNAPVLIAEACAHHAQNDDIARVKIPMLLQKRLGHRLNFSFCSGGDFPDDLARYALTVHCGGCMLNSGEMRRRLRLCAAEGVPATNFGMAISVVQGLLDRVAAPFMEHIAGAH